MLIRLKKINFQDGQFVQQGAVILELESHEENAQLESALSAYRESEKQYRRAKELRRKGATSQSTLDQQGRIYEIAKAQVEVAKARLQDHVIRAPFAGTLGMREVSPGAYVQAGEKITTLTDAATMRLDFSVPEIFLSSVRPGQEVAVQTVAYRGRIFKGLITALDNNVDPVSRSFSVRAVLPNDDGVLKAGMLMSVEIEKAPEMVLALPEGTLIPESTRNYVFVVEQNDEMIVAKKEVKIGRRQIGLVEIYEGLEEGELVVSHGSLKLADGRTVKILANQADGRSIPEILKDLGQHPQGKQN